MKLRTDPENLKCWLSSEYIDGFLADVWARPVITDAAVAHALVKAIGEDWPDDIFAGKDDICNYLEERISEILTTDFGIVDSQEVKSEGGINHGP